MEYKTYFLSQNNLRFAAILPSNYLTAYDIVRTYLTRHATQKSIKTFRETTKAFESSFFPYCAKEWGNPSEELRNIDLIKTFNLSILNFVSLVFAVHDINDL